MSNGSERPKQPDHHKVVSLKVTGGFLGGAKLEFADGLNCLIGGRGTGKTTALEFLRFGLGLMPDPKTNAQRHRAIDGLVRANLSSGRLAVEVLTKNGMRYTAGRAATEAVQVVNEVGTAVPVSLDRDQIFGADVFSQNEIEEIASSPSAQLALLDRFVEEETSAIARDLGLLQRRLSQTTVDLKRLDQDIDDLRATASELPVLEEKLKGIAQLGGPDAAKINLAHAAKTTRAREALVPEQIISAIQKAVRDAAAASGGFQASLKAQLDSSVRDGVNRDVFQPLEKDAQSFAHELAAATASIGDAAHAVEARIKAHGVTLAGLHALQEAEYRTVIAASEEESGRSAERTALQASFAAAVSAAKEQEGKMAHRQALAQSRSDLLKRTSELRDQRFAARKRVAERLTQQFTTIRVTVIQAADVQKYRELITEALKGGGLKQGPVAERLSQVFLPTELSKAVASRNHEVIVQRAGFDLERAKKVVDALGANGAAYEIEEVDLEDRPSIELLDGDQYKESPNLSTGQRCTTVLPILLVQSERPLLIDQPEDNLDNAFVYETVVKALLAVRGARQVIFVTHNPNIPVLGQADRVFVFASDGKHATLRQVGTVDECKDQIETILEGGKDAFLQRKARYGH